ncbi:DUF3168 domain-containing protein [Shimia sp. Alg240-R146]|uniref:DUF3168 domain-containing protein n=1 Tax=Shimia sp. Alg240-R146 TaxID=2993449 RepID=UPI0022E1342E|nr:DUF3168 domain-containing protein [Shimia sp. Alg240-R146]
MSYGAAQALQQAIFERLSTDVGVIAEVGTAVYDAVPQGNLPNLYVSLGQETALDRSDKDSAGIEHRFVISVIADQAGYAGAKSAAGAICDALVDADLALSRGRLVYLNFDRAVARKDTSANLRRIDLRFRARIEDMQP